MGNIRTVLDESGGVVQKTDYYPFGLAHSTGALDKNKYLYNGKELQDDILSGTEFGNLDYGARFCDPMIGRWHVVDPLAEKSRRFSPYAYVANNPMKYIDPNGMEIIVTGDKAKKTVKEINKASSLKITMDGKTGALSAKGEAKSEADKKIAAAISNPNMKLELVGTKKKELPDGSILSDGAYGGQTLSEDGKSVSAIQYINPDATEKIDNFYKKPGANALHETAELVVGAEKALESGKATSYDDAHNETEKIAPQSGMVYYTMQEGTMIYYVGDGKTPKTTIIYNKYKPDKK